MSTRNIYDKVDIVIAVGSPSFSLAKTLKKGICKGVKVVHISSATPVNQAVNINVTDGNNTILGATDFRDSINAGGGYVAGFKPCSFDTKFQITVDAIAEGNIATADFKAQLIFLIEEECND